MAHGVTTLAVAFCLPLLSAGAAFPQTSPGATPNPTPARVSDVYVGTSNGIYLYHAASTGKLSLVSGSPYPVTGTAIGSNHNYFFSQDPNYLHSYSVASNGAIKGQASRINTRSYSGSECGLAKLAVLDHSGDDVYAQLSGDPNGGSDGACVALQSFKVSSTGALSFLGTTQYATEGETDIGGSATPVTLTGNDRYAYSAAYDHECELLTFELKRESSGSMSLDTYGNLMKVPSTPPDWRWYPWYVTADGANRLAVGMIGESGSFGPCGDEIYPAQLASFTVASDGSLSTTNTPDKMPAPKVFPQVLKTSFAGQFLAVGGSSSFDTGDHGTQTTGLQLFHFNGANPITSYSKVLTTAPINEIHWDRNDHLYALSNSTHKLYVYNVTSASITPAPGSPYTVPSTPNALSLVSLTCSAPASDGVHICAPAGGSTVASPVLVAASAKVSGTFDRMELWVDGVKKYVTNSPQLDTSLKLAAGKHHFSFVAINTNGQKWNNAIYATVK